MIPPKPTPRADKVSLLTYLRLFRADILSAQPARLYHALMAEFRTPFFRSYLVNDPALIARILTERPDDFPKSLRIAEGLRPLLGNSVFVTNGEVWKRQRRIIDPAFEGGRLRDTFPAMLAATQAAVARMPLGHRRGRGTRLPRRRRRDLSHPLFDPHRKRDRHGGLRGIPRLSAQPAHPEPGRLSADSALVSPLSPQRDQARRPRHPLAYRPVNQSASGCHRVRHGPE